MDKYPPTIIDYKVNDSDWRASCVFVDEPLKKGLGERKMWEAKDRNRTREYQSDRISGIAISHEGILKWN